MDDFIDKDDIEPQFPIKIFNLVFPDQDTCNRFLVIRKRKVSHDREILDQYSDKDELYYTRLSYNTRNYHKKPDNLFYLDE